MNFSTKIQFFSNCTELLQAKGATIPCDFKTHYHLQTGFNVGRQKAHEKGLLQLVDYLNIQSLSEGYLLIFDHSEIKNWQSEWIETDGKRIFIAWV